MIKDSKRLLAAAISLITVFAVCISTVFIVGANGDDNTYGSESGGIKGNSDATLAITPVDGLQNGDFEQGLKYWGGVDGCTDPSTIATVKSEDGNKYLHIDTTSVSTKYQGVLTVPFKVAGVKVGDYVGVRLKYRSSDTDTTSIRVGLSQNHYYRSAYKACNTMYAAPDADGKWQTLVTTATENGGTLKAVNDPGNGGDIFFMLRITGNGSDIVCDIDDIEIVKFTDETGASYETASYGTADDGIILSSSNKSVSNLSAIDGFNNFDFSSGLVNFGPRDTWTGFWEKLSVIGITAENGMLKMSHTTDKNADNDYPGFRSVNVKIPDSAKGKKVFVNLDAATNLDFAVRIIVNGENRSNWIWVRTYDCSSDVTAPTLKNVTAKENFNGFDIADSDTEIAVEVQAQNKDGKCVYIDNIKFIYFDGNSTSGPFTDLAGNKYDKDGVLIGSSGDEDDDPDDIYGTAADGMKQNVNPRELPPTEKTNNLDFSKGFKYWGSSQTSFKTTDVAKLVSEDGNTYVQLTPNKSYDGGWGGIISAPFYLNVKPGTNLSLLYDWKGSGDYMVKLVQQNVSQAGADIKCDGSGNVIKAAATEDGWNSSYQTVKNSVVEDDINDGLYSFFIYIQPKGGFDVPPDTCFDNIRIVQVSGSGSDAILYDLDGNLIILDDSESGDEYGTKANGIDISKDPRKLTPTDSPKNLDFSEGFRYWGTQESNFKASDAARLKTNDGNTYIQLTPDPSYAGGWGGLTSAPFYLDVKEGTTLSLLYDWKGDPNVLLKLVQCQLPEGKTSKKCDAGPTTNMVVIGETDDAWNTSWNYTFDPVLADDTDDGRYCFYIFLQPAAGVDPVQDTCFDNIRIVSVEGVGTSAKLYDLNGNLISFDDNTSDDNTGDDDTGDDDTGNDNTDDNNNNDNNGGNSTVDNNNGSNNSSNNSNTGNGSNSGSTSSGNYNANNGNSGNNWSGLVNADDIDVTEAMSQINKLNSGETVDFITLFNLDTSNGGINAYISIKTLKDKELKALKSMSEQQLKNTAVTLRAILSTMVSTPNAANAKAFTKLGGNPTNTLPLSFTGHINLDFTVNIRIKMASGSLSSDTTYYAYHCNPDTRVIDNLGKVNLEEDGSNTYITIRTNSFSDFFISPDNFKAQANSNAGAAAEETNNYVIWIIIGGAALLLVAVVVVVIVILSRRKKLIK